MFERFTDRARRVVVLAQEEARMLNHNYIGTEHLLLGLLREAEGVAARALESLGISLEAVRSQVEEIIGQGTEATRGHIPFTPRAKKVLELSLREALQLTHNYIGTEHILLGLVREGEGVAAQVLLKFGAGLDAVRERVIQVLSAGPQGRPSERSPADAGSAEEREALGSAAGPISDRARHVMIHAKLAQARFGVHWLEPEPLILGLLHAEEAGGAELLRSAGTDVDRLRSRVESDLQERSSGKPEAEEA